MEKTLEKQIYDKHLAYGALVILSFPDLQTEKTFIQKLPVKYPYISTYFALREAPMINSLLNDLEEPLDLLFIDGNGNIWDNFSHGLSQVSDLEIPFVTAHIDSQERSPLVDVSKDSPFDCFCHILYMD